jgi:hypothetical protein
MMKISMVIIIIIIIIIITEWNYLDTSRNTPEDAQ